jgi:uncharacterized protein
MSLAPTKNQRIQVIDVLRGFALLGIIMIHMVEQYYAGAPPEEVIKGSQTFIVDGIFSAFASIFIMGKFYMIFSFLFGLSFFIQSSKGEDDKYFVIRFVWRLLLLFLIGMIHHIHYRGDILTIYAILGLGLLLFYRAPDKVLLYTGIILVINIPSLLIRISEGLITGTATLFPEQEQAFSNTYYQTVSSGSYLEILRLNYLSFATKMWFQLFSGRIFITLGLFLLGVYAGRKNLFHRMDENLGLVKKLIGYSWKSLIVIIVVLAILFGGAALLKITLPQYINVGIGGFGYDLFNTCMFVIYMGVVILLFQKARWSKRLMIFYEAGRMGLTTYLMQSLFGFLIFFSPGLGLLYKLGAATCFGLAVVLFIGQIIFSKLWFRYFYYGFFEWAWRSLTYLKVQRFLKAQKVIPSVTSPLN